MYYETTFIVNPDVSQENTQNITNQLVERVEKAGGRVIKREYWGARMMAYSINKRKRGHYMFLVTDGDGAAIDALEGAIRLDERIVRFLSVRSETFSDQPSPLARRSKPANTEATSAETANAESTEAAGTETANAEPTGTEPATEAKTEESTPAEKAPVTTEEKTAETSD